MSQPDPGIDWKLWARELSVQLDALLTEITLTEERRRSIPKELRELVQGAIELEAEAAACCG